VRVADQLAEHDGEPTVRFQSAEGLAMQMVTVVPGRATAAEFRVRWRSYVEILGTTSDRESANALLRVERLDPQSGIRRALPAPRISVRNGRPPQFAGWLAEGTYWLTFTSPQGQVHRESLQVADKGIKRSFQLPW
jgi:hypothetical protein